MRNIAHEGNQKSWYFRSFNRVAMRIRFFNFNRKFILLVCYFVVTHTLLPLLCLCILFVALDFGRVPLAPQVIVCAN